MRVMAHSELATTVRAVPLPIEVRRTSRLHRHAVTVRTGATAGAMSYNHSQAVPVRSSLRAGGFGTSPG